jgi:hypothetical protein
MFGLRRRQVSADTTSAMQLSTEQLYDLVHHSISNLIGKNGEWVVSRRTIIDEDDIFHDMLARSVSLKIISQIDAAQAAHLRALEPEPILTKPIVLSWVSTPVTGWAKVELHQQKHNSEHSKLVA